MKNIQKAVALFAAGAIVISSLGAMGCASEHKHSWSDWTRTETTHSRRCIGCGEMEEGTHATDVKCGDCGAHFKALALGFTSGGDSAHADFAVEANEWFAQKGEEFFFTYEFSTDFNKLNDEELANYDIVLLLNTAPGGQSQQVAFRKYVENGGAVMAFHSAAFAMWDNHTPPSEWADWYHNTLLGSGEYGNRPYEDDPSKIYWNTWNPTADYLRIEDFEHFATRNLEYNDDGEFLSAPCEWYAWSNDLINDPNFTVLLTLNPTPERPAGDDPREGYEYQIWTSGHHPIAWASNTYKMIYMNWGHNLQSYNHFEKESETFSCTAQGQFVLDGMYGLVV